MIRLCAILSVQILFLFGCALSPQIVTLEPDLQAVRESIFQERKSIGLIVTDSRTSNIIGQRGGVYRNTAGIYTEGDITDSLKNLISQKLQGLGYNISNGKENALLTITIAELKYSISEKKTVNEVETTADVRTECQNGDFSLKNTYKVTNKKDVLTFPTGGNNQKTINDTLADSLNRMLKDEQLFECLNK